ncbi:MAG TPA: flavin reductase family protein [Actinocrinis sp.]|nr:flavin reductase family protein [Actinocrinis sp.]
MSVDVHETADTRGRLSAHAASGPGDSVLDDSVLDDSVLDDSVLDGSGLDPATLRRVFGAYPTGVTALAALVDGEPVGMAANSFTSVSLDPPLVSVCVATSSQTWPALRGSARLGVSVLSHEQEQASRSLAARGTDRFAGLSWCATPDGAVLLAGASAWLDCSVDREIRAGDHEIVLLRVHSLGSGPEVAPLVFHGSRYRRLAA